jgi:uncharacterized protein YciI
MNRIASRVVLSVCALVALGAVGSARTAVPTAADSPPPEVTDMLQLQLWVIMATDNPRKPYANDIFKRHIAHQVELEKKGVLFGAGPFFDTAGKREFGVIIVRASSALEAKAIADSDPMHIEGYRTYTLHRWRLNEGRISLTVDYSDGKAVIK